MQRGQKAQKELLVGLILPQVLLEPDDLLPDLRSIGEHMEVLWAEHLDESQVERAVEVKEAGDGGAIQDAHLLHLPVEHGAFVYFIQEGMGGELTLEGGDMFLIAEQPLVQKGPAFEGLCALLLISHLFGVGHGLD